MRNLRSALLPLAAAVLTTAPAACQDADPYERPDNDWIVIEGTVEEVMPDQFILDYGDGLITVEMDDGDRDADGYVLAPEDEVRVSGRIDDDLFEMASIEASSVYVENLGTTFYASPLDEEDAVAVMTLVDPAVVISRTVVEGPVTEVGEDQFVVDTGEVQITVDTELMPYDPLDDEGYQRIDVGDRVQVTGTVDYDFFDGRVLDARAITTLVNR